MTDTDVPARPEVRWFTAEQAVSLALLEEAGPTMVTAKVWSDAETKLTKELASQGFTQVFGFQRWWLDADLPVAHYALDLLGVKEAPGG
jgi:hypothetical protein